MLSEAEPVSPVRIENIYKSFEELLRGSSILPREFYEGTRDLAEPERKELIYKGTDAISDQLFAFIELLKELDPNSYKSRVRNLLKTAPEIPSHLKEDINDKL